MKEGAKERLPGTKQPLAVSKAWQEHLAGQPSVEVPGQAEAREPRPAKLRTRRTLLPGSLSVRGSNMRPALFFAGGGGGRCTASQATHTCFGNVVNSPQFPFNQDPLTPEPPTSPPAKSPTSTNPSEG